jgi:hypothetical protein
MDPSRRGYHPPRSSLFKSGDEGNVGTDGKENEEGGAKLQVASNNGKRRFAMGLLG